jgi:hypothetical protein
MGKYIFDQYTLLHFTSGIVCRYFNFSLIFLFVFHVIFEYIENTKKGMHIINNYLKIWPGGKTSSDTFINSVSDIIISLIGWICMDFLIKKNMIKLGSEFSLGVLLYFWFFPKYGLLICILISLLIYSITKYNVSLGFLLALLLDKIVLYYDYNQAHVI